MWKSIFTGCSFTAKPQTKLSTTALLFSDLFGPLQLVGQCLFGDLHLDDLLSEQLVLVLSSAAFVLHDLQLVVQTYRYIFGHLRSHGPKRFKHNARVNMLIKVLLYWLTS